MLWGFFLGAAASFSYLLSEAPEVGAEPLSHHWGGWVGPCSCCPLESILVHEVLGWRSTSWALCNRADAALADRSHPRGASVGSWWRLGLAPCPIFCAPCSPHPSPAKRDTWESSGVLKRAIQIASRSIQQEQGCHQQCQRWTELRLGWSRAALRQAVFIFVDELETINSVIKYC